MLNGYRRPPPVIDPPSNKDLTLFRLTPSNKGLAREGRWRGGVMVMVAGRGEGGCEGANGVVAGLDGLKINALMYKKCLFSPKKHTPSNKDLVILTQNQFYYWGGLRYVV